MPFNIPESWRRRAVFALAVGASLATVGSAHADGVTNPTDCVPDHDLSQPFSAFGDSSDYALAPGGDFETDDWTFSGLGALVDINQPFDIGTVGTTSAVLSKKASVTSPEMCIDDTYPYFRAFVRGVPGAEVKASVLFQDDNGQTVARDSATIKPGLNWAPTPQLSIDVPWDVQDAPGSAAPVRFRFTVTKGLALIDDVYVDPYARH